MTPQAHTRGMAFARTSLLLAIAAWTAACGGEDSPGTGTGTRPERMSALFEPPPATAEHPPDNPGTPSAWRPAQRNPAPSPDEHSRVASS